MQAFERKGYSETISIGFLVLAIGLVGGPASAQPVYGDNLPDELINGDPYPSAEATIDSWINQGQTPDLQAIAAHGWGLWVAATQLTKTEVPKFSGGRIYNTWLSPEQVRGLSRSEALTASAEAGKTSVAFAPPAQFGRIRQGTAQLKATAPTSPLEWIAESVAYSPSAAQHAHEANLFQIATLQGLQKPGEITEIPAFPTDAMVLKPVFTAIAASELDENGLYKMPVWPGTPDQPQAFASDKWGACIYVDPKNGGAGDGEIDQSCNTPTKETTYNISDFIALTATETQTVMVSTSAHETKTVTLEPGDHMVLVGMHMSTREITQWTWQSFWWTPTPDAPHAPSSAEIASLRPEGVEDAVRHYAMTLAYMMVDPAQPIAGGESTGEPVIGFNPHLEAPFDKNVFSVHRPISGKTEFVGEFGVQSNCMTCHAMANFGGGSKLGYGTDFYIGRTDEAFVGSVQTDFLWSIPDTAEK